MLSVKEFRRMGFNELRGGYVLTGGSMKMQGVLELAQVVFQANARIAIPNYIGVREPQFTVGVGTLQFSYYNAKIQGKNLSSGLTVDAPAQQSAPKPKRKVQQKSEPKSDEPKESKVANFFKSFFE